MKDLLRRKAKSVNLYGASREIFEAAWQGVVPLCWHERMEDAVPKPCVAVRPAVGGGPAVQCVESFGRADLPFQL